jgi:FMNH2-dependent dimethyl sulfone monooxygenase
MQFGLYCPIPMATVGSPEVAQAAADALGPLPAGQRDLQFEIAVDLLTAADKSGFNLCLFAERHLGHDLAAWVTASSLGSRLDNIRALTAVHPGLVDPVMIAKLAASLDRIVRKRMAINIVNGWFDEEFVMFGGKVLQGEERYERAVEFIDILRGLWTNETFTLHGKHYHIDKAQLLLKPASPTPPEIFSVSRSDRGRDFIADHCDWWFIDFPKEAETTD